MGVGGVTAMGCTVGQGLSGCPRWRWAASSPGGIVAGAMLALRYQVWRLERRRDGAPVLPSAGRPGAPLRRPAPSVRRRGLPRLRAPAWPWWGWAAWARGRWKRWRAAAWRGWCCSTWTTSPNPTSTARCRRWNTRWARPRCRRCASASPTSTRAADVRGVEDFVSAANWPALLPTPVDVLVDACDQVQAKAALAAWSLREGRPLVCVGAAGGKRQAQRVEVADLADTTHDPLLASLRQRLRRTAPRRGRAHGRALRVLARERGAAGRQPATRATAASTATAMDPASP
jgi:hypothetical protein